MSDTQQGADWWRASDGKWYPPTPLPPPPQETLPPTPLPPPPQETLPPPPQGTLPPPQRETRAQRNMRKARERVQEQLEPGEQIEALFMGQTGPSPRGALSLGLTSNLMAYWTVAVTDRNIVVVSSTSRKGPARLPREPMQILEEKSRRWWFPIRIGGERYWVATEEYDIVVAANERLRSEAATPVAAVVIDGAAIPPDQPAGSTSAAWYPDPGGRHQHRYWDGQNWTAYVADQGVQSIDAAQPG